MRNTILAVLFSLSATGCITALDLSGSIATVPFELYEDNRVIVQTMVNGKGPFRFAIDTAASISAVFAPLARQLDVSTNDGRQVMVQGLLEAGYFPTARLDQIALGGALWNGAQVVVLPGDQSTARGLAGILGLDFLRQYVLVYSKQDKVVRLFAPAALDEDRYRGWSTINLHAHQVGVKGAVLYATELNASPESIPAIIDLGAGLNMMNFPAAKIFGLKPEALRGGSGTTLSGALGSESRLYRIILRRAQTASVVWFNESFIVADLPVFAAIVAPEKPAVILGAEMLLRRDIVFDFSRNRLLVSQTRSPGRLHSVGNTAD